MDFLIKMFCIISGISAASGIQYSDDQLYIVSDNSFYLYNYDIHQKKLDKIPLLPNLNKDSAELVDKKHKLDIESIAYNKGNYFLLSSGSRFNRNKSFSYNPKSHDVTQNDVSVLFKELKNMFSISDDDFNIEGSVFQNENTLLLFNRGNGPHKKNSIIKVDLKNTKKSTIYNMTLPNLDNVALGFTDATIVGNKIYFLAAAESTESSYLDGKIKGSALGVINLKTLKLENCTTISKTQKFEGITLYEKNKNGISFLICEDPDNDSTNSTIYKLEINNK